MAVQARATPFRQRWFRCSPLHISFSRSYRYIILGSFLFLRVAELFLSRKLELFRMHSSIVHRSACIDLHSLDFGATRRKLLLLVSDLVPLSGSPLIKKLFRMSTTAPNISHPSSSQSGPGSSSGTSSNQLYSLASRVPLIKSPSISLPKPVKLPPDLHPLPADISAYFVYPFSLESYVLDPNTPSSSTVDQLLAKHQQYLDNRQREKEQKQKELLRKVAPGWQGDVLLPTSSSKAALGEAAPADQEKQHDEDHKKEERTPLDDLADHLAQLDALNSSSGPPSNSYQQRFS